MAIALTGCGGGGGSAGGGTGSGGTEDLYFEVVENPEFAAGTTPARLAEQGSIIVGVKFDQSGIGFKPPGQETPIGSEAAYAIGLRKGQVLALILAPQAVRSMLPAIVSQCVVALKDTALGFTIGYAGFVHEAEFIFIAPIYNNPIAVGIMLMAVYVAINYSLSRLAQWLEQRQRSVRGGVGAPAAVPDAQ